ncbi:MAG: hypothetical protein ACLSDQ_13220 [Adlercreutzia equolifaciens]
MIAVALAAGLSLFFGSTPIARQVLVRSRRTANQERGHPQLRGLHGGLHPRGAAFAVAGAIMQGMTRNPGRLGAPRHQRRAAFALALCLALPT